MLTCITCSKTTEDGDDARRGTPTTKDAVKNLTLQIKDIALKVSGKGKPCQAEGTYKKDHPNFDTISEGVPYPGSSINPTWGFTSTGQRSTQTDSRLSPFGDGVSISAQSGEVVLQHEDESNEWAAQVEPGVQITFVSLPGGGNDLKRIRFSREMFNKWQAQRWWSENYDRIMELYNVQRFNQQATNTPGRSEDGRDSTYSRLGSTIDSPRMTALLNKEWTPRYKPESLHGGGSSAFPTGGQKGEMEASRTTTSSLVSVSNASEIESEWIEEDEAGVYITIRQLVDGTRELRRVRFSRDKFGEVHAKLWWETNRDRIQAQYLC